MIAALRRAVTAVGATPWFARWSAAIAWAAVLWFLSSRPSHGGVRTLAGALLWNAGHVVAYCVLAALLFLALREPVACSRRRAFAAALLAACYGAIDEWHQSTVPGRDCSAFDIASDALGAVLAVVTLLWLDGAVRARWIVWLLPCCAAAVVAATLPSR